MFAMSTGHYGGLCAPGPKPVLLHLALARQAGPLNGRWAKCLVQWVRSHTYGFGS